MRRRTLILLAAVVAASAAAGAAQGREADRDERDLKGLQGTWQVQSATRNGNDMPAGDVAKVKMTFDGTNVALTTPEGKQERATIRLDAGKKPSSIDIKPPRDDKPSRGIYELDGDTLKLCFSRQGGERPTEFASRKGSFTTLIVLKRVKK
jgi:uncharacterized protein (TIGR03067 family)